MDHIVGVTETLESKCSTRSDTQKLGWMYSTPYHSQRNWSIHTKKLYKSQSRVWPGSSQAQRERHLKGYCVTLEGSHKTLKNVSKYWSHRAHSQTCTYQPWYAMVTLTLVKQTEKKLSTECQNSDLFPIMQWAVWTFFNSALWQVPQ